MPRGRKKFVLGELVWEPIWRRWGFVTDVMPHRIYSVSFVSGEFIASVGLGSAGQTFFAAHLQRCLVTFVGAVPLPDRRRNRRKHA